MDTSVTRLYVGSSGFSYPSWRPGFYPDDARPADFLAHYASRLPSVELNSTFYRLPAEVQFERWASAVPRGFRFAVTMSRQITHFRGLDGIPAFCQSVRALGNSLGPMRVKLPQARDDGFLLLLLDSLDPELRFALDFHHDSWAAPEVDTALAERGIARVGSLEGTAPFSYLRLRDPPHDDEELDAWAESIRPLLAGDREVYCYFRHEDEPTAPAYATRLRELLAGAGGSGKPG